MSKKSGELKAYSMLANIDWKNFAAGTAGGAVSTALFHPLDLIKIRWQVYENASLKLLRKSVTNNTVQSRAPEYRPNYKSILDTISSIYKSEKGVRGLYRGVIINTFASGTAWGTYFFLYNGLKNYHISSSSNKLMTFDYTLYATMASVITICITNPLFLIKTRMCLQYANQGNNLVKVVQYKNSLDAFMVLLKTEGFAGMYRGLFPGLFGTLNGTIQMVCYENMKSAWLERLERRAKANGETEKQKLNTAHFSTFSSISKIVSVICTYPFQLVRSRIQDQHQNYENIADVIKKTYRNERLYGFYKGLIPGLARVVPAASVTFIVYENLLEFLKRS